MLQELKNYSLKINKLGFRKDSLSNFLAQYLASTSMLPITTIQGLELAHTSKHYPFI